jgi:hypothetical protein
MKRILQFLAVILVAALFTFSPFFTVAVFAEAGLNGYWEFNNGSANDTSGNGNNGTLYGSPATVTGIHNQALSFDGSNYMSAPDSTTLNFGTGDLSISFWFKTSSSNYIQTIIDKRDGNYKGYCVCLYNQKILFQFGDSSGYSSFLCTNGSNLNDGQWHFAVCAVDRDNSSGLKIYVDNTLINTFDPTVRTGSITNTADLLIANHITNSYRFPGVLDEIAFRTRALDAVEVTDIYLQRWLMAKYEFISGNADDTSGNNNNGAISGSPSTVTGIHNQALSFSGSNYITVADSSTINVGTGDFSISCWIKTSSSNTTQTFIDKRDGSYKGYCLCLYNQKPLIQFGDTSGYSSFIASNSPVLNDGKWHLVICTIDRDDSNGLKIYVDGSLANTFDPTGRPGDTTNTASLYIARRQDNYCNFPGALDEINLYGRALGADEIPVYYKKGWCVAEYQFINGGTEDTSGNGNNGTLYGSGTPTIVTGVVNQALDFGGVSYMKVPDSTSINFGTGDFSIAFWMKTSYQGSVDTILDKRTADNYIGYHVALYSGQLLLQITDSGGYTNYRNLYSTALNDGQWHHVVFTVDRDNASGLCIYADGQLVGTFDPTDRTGDITNAADLLIGKHINSNDSCCFNGQLDQFRLYNRALSASEVANE